VSAQGQTAAIIRRTGHPTVALPKGVSAAKVIKAAFRRRDFRKSLRDRSLEEAGGFFARNYFI